MSLNKNNDSQNNNNNNKKKAIIQFVALAIMCGISLFLFYDAFLSPGALEEAPYVEFMEAVENDEVFVIEYDRDCTFFYWYTELDPAELEEKTVPENLKFNFAELLASAQEDEETKSEETEEVPQETIKIGDTERPVPEFVERHKSANPTYSEFKKDMLERGITVKEADLNSKPWDFLVEFVFSLVPYALMLVMLSIIMTRMQGGEEITIETTSTKKFEDVAGLEEVKESALIIVDMLKNPKKYSDAGARISKGVILYGPPGTGKTLLAKAIAGEAGVNFLACSAADFENKFVGVGANNVRNLFKQAKAQAPCILFIDEIDAVGCKRAHESHSFERQTINALLACMDGFGTDDGITVFAATNDVESLDPALLRPGRFDSRFAVGLPDTSEDRKSIAKLYLKNKRIAEDIDLDVFAKETLGCSPADIEVIINEAAIDSVKNNGIITKENLDNAFYKHIMHGHKKKSSDRDNKEIKTTAWHEAGHALVGWLLGEEITKISIVPTTSGAGGVTIFNQKKLGMYSKKELENKIKMLYAGRNAELILNGPEGITSGASQDIKEATKIISNMINYLGMSDFGLLDLSSLSVGNDAILKECQSISAAMNKASYDLLVQNKEHLEELSAILIKEETIDAQRLQEIFNGWDEE